MKTAFVILFLLLSCPLFTACTDKAATKPESTAFGGGESVEDDKYGKLTELDKKRMGDHDVTLYVNEWRVGNDKDIKEPVLRVYLSGAEPEKRVVHAWLVDFAGNDLTPHAIGEWRKSDGSFLCVLDFKTKSVSTGACKLWLSVDDAKDSWEVTIK